MAKSLSEIFHDTDKVFMEELGRELMMQISEDLRAPKQLSIRDVGKKNGVPSSTVVQVARYLRFDPNTLEPVK